jgi:hypothetical protein
LVEGYLAMDIGDNPGAVRLQCSVNHNDDHVRRRHITQAIERRNEINLAPLGIGSRLASWNMTLVKSSAFC